MFEKFSLPQHGRPLFTSSALNLWRCKNNNKRGDSHIFLFILVDLLFNIFNCFIMEILPLSLLCHCLVIAMLDVTTYLFRLACLLTEVTAQEAHNTDLNMR